MLHSPCGKRKYARQRYIQKANGDDVLEFLNIDNPTYKNEVDFLLKHCKRKCVNSSKENKLFCKIRSSCSITRFKQTDSLWN